MVLEGFQDHPIEISDTLAPIPIAAPGGNLLVEIVDGTNDEVVQAEVRQVMREKREAFGIDREIFEEGEDVMDVLCQVAVRDQEIPRYT